MPDELREAALNLMEAAHDALRSLGGKEHSTVEIMGMATVALNEVNRELTYGLWKSGELLEPKQ